MLFSEALQLDENEQFNILVGPEAIPERLARPDGHPLTVGDVPGITRQSSAEESPFTRLRIVIPAASLPPSTPDAMAEGVKAALNLSVEVPESGADSGTQQYGVRVGCGVFILVFL